jgi:hypothetical protein
VWRAIWTLAVAKSRVVKTYATFLREFGLF